MSGCENRGDLMLSEALAGIIIFISIFLFIIIVGGKIFSLFAREQIHYLYLIIFYARFPNAAPPLTVPGPVSRYLTWAIGKNSHPAGCARVRYTGRTRFGAKGRWMKTKGEAIFACSTPGFTWHAKIAFAPMIWIDAFDYYVHGDAAVKLNLFSVLPLNNSHSSRIKTGSLFRYLASIPFFPIALSSSGSITWEPVDDSTAKATIHDGDLSARALFRFDSRGQIESIGIDSEDFQEQGTGASGHFRQRYFGYTNIGGYQVPLQITSDMVLPDGKHACEEYTITGIDYDCPAGHPWGGA
jgi:hypothetical protein